MLISCIEDGVAQMLIGGLSTSIGLGQFTNWLKPKECQSQTDNQVKTWADLKTRLDVFYTRLACEASGATIRVMGYPKMMMPVWGDGILSTDDVIDRCPGVTGISGREAAWIDAMAGNLNEVVSTAVRDLKATKPKLKLEFTSVQAYFQWGACAPEALQQINDKVCLDGGRDWQCLTSQPKDWFWGLVSVSQGVSTASFHPTKFGYQRNTQAFLNSLP